MNWDTATDEEIPTPQEHPTISSQTLREYWQGDASGIIIPYRPDLRKFCGSISATVLFQQLLFRFRKRDCKPFYKFMKPSPDHNAYQQGDSWAEEIEISAEEFRTAFDKIGMRYPTKSAFYKKSDPFEGKFFASYVDKRTNMTWYFVNLAAVNAIVDTLIPPKVQQSPKSKSKKPVVPISGDCDCQSPEMVNDHLPYNQKKYTKNKNIYAENSDLKKANIPTSEIRVFFAAQYKSFRRGNYSFSKNDKVLLDKLLTVESLDSIKQKISLFFTDLPIGNCRTWITTTDYSFGVFNKVYGSIKILSSKEKAVIQAGLDRFK
jgi:hypothetical protein